MRRARLTTVYVRLCVRAWLLRARVLPLEEKAMPAGLRALGQRAGIHAADHRVAREQLILGDLPGQV